MIYFILGIIIIAICAVWYCLNYKSTLTKKYELKEKDLYYQLKKQIEDKELSNKLIDEFLSKHLSIIGKMKTDGELKVREEHQPAIKTFLEECDFPHIEKMRELLHDVRTITEQEDKHVISYFRN